MADAVDSAIPQYGEVANPQDGSARTAPWRSLLHRWLVQYNPMYLLSAALVLGGVILLSRGLAREGTVYGQVGVAAIAEAYSWALIGGAALLVRLRLRRPAVMLALLTALYQGDLTLHTETCAFLGSVGLVAVASWLVSFVAKLMALAWAMRVRASPGALAILMLGAVGLAVLPHYLHAFSTSTWSSLVSLWVFALFAAGLWSAREVRSLEPLDGWGRTVLRRSLRAIWAMWAMLVVCHVAFWATESRLDLVALVPVALLLSTRWIRTELGTWLAVVATWVLVAVAIPPLFAVTALMSAVVLALRAWRHPSVVSQPPSTVAAGGPYRAPPEDPATGDRPARVIQFTLAPKGSRVRLLAGSLFAVHLAAWTAGWTGGAWPTHVLVLDLLLTAIVVAFAWRAAGRVAIAPLAVVWLHHAVQTGWLTAPDTLLGWGATAVGAGFALLGISILTSWRLGAPPAPTGSAGPPGG